MSAACKEITEALRLWSAEQGATHLAPLKIGDYLAHVPRGGLVRHIGRIDGFTLEMRGAVPGGIVHALRPGDSMRTEAVALIRVATRLAGRMSWSAACQCIPERALAAEWRAADSSMVRDVLRQIEGVRERYSAAYYDPELSPDKGR